MHFLQQFVLSCCICDFNIDFALISKNIRHNQYVPDTFPHLRMKHWREGQTVTYLRQLVADLSLSRFMLNPRTGNVGFVVDIMVLWVAFLGMLLFAHVTISQAVLRTQNMYYSSTVQLCLKKKGIGSFHRTESSDNEHEKKIPHSVFRRKHSVTFVTEHNYCEYLNPQLRSI